LFRLVPSNNYWPINEPFIQMNYSYVCIYIYIYIYIHTHGRGITSVYVCW
jgi:hypothetical protein